jgi:hypothetical protein
VAKKTQPFDLRYRQIHLDFHTSEAIRDVGRDFDAREFARMMKDAHVDSVTVFAKCHHGHLYYNTDHPARHPGLKRNLGLLEEQVEALHAEGIRAPIYLSVQCDEYAANQHPEWVVYKDDGKLHMAPPVADPYPGFTWQILDMSSPYQDYLAEQTAEVLKKFHPVDGIFFDMCWDQRSVTRWAKAGMYKLGLEPSLEADRLKYAHHVAIAYMKRFHKQVKQANPDAGVYFNSRPLFNLAEEIPYLAQVEIEALPTGGWGYMYFPKNVRFARTFDKPYMGMTARFHKSWADFGGIKPYPALEYETSQMIAHGAKCSVGDQLHPRGTLDKAAYALIGKVYKRVADREPWLRGAVPQVEAAVLQVEIGDGKETAGTPEGAVRFLQQERVQFDVVARAGDFSKYKLIVLPDVVEVDAALAAKLTAFHQAGGAILATGRSGLADDGTAKTLDLLPIKPAGKVPFATTYVRFDPSIANTPGAFDAAADTEHVFYDPAFAVTPAKGGRSVATVVEPYFNRSYRHFSSHAQTPPAKDSPFSAAVLGDRVAYVPYPLFAMISKHGNQTYKLLLRHLLHKLLPNRLLTATGPTGLETTLTRQPKTADSPARSIVHLLYYPVERRTEKLDLVEDLVPLHDTRVSVRVGTAKPKRAYLAPEGTDLPSTRDGDRVHVTIPHFAGHAMVVIE